MNCYVCIDLGYDDLVWFPFKLVDTGIKIHFIKLIQLP